MCSVGAFVDLIDPRLRRSVVIEDRYRRAALTPSVPIEIRRPNWHVFSSEPFLIVFSRTAD